MDRDDREWLLELRERLLHQDNQCTGDPVFLVQQRKRDYGYDTDYAEFDQIAWLSEGYECDKEDSAKLEKDYEESGTVPDDLTRTAYVDRWEFVQAFLTQAAAEHYVASNAHRMTDPRIFVDSGYRNKEWIRLRAILMDPEFAALGASTEHPTTPEAESSKQGLRP